MCDATHPEHGWKCWLNSTHAEHATFTDMDPLKAQVYWDNESFIPPVPKGKAAAKVHLAQLAAKVPHQDRAVATAARDDGMAQVSENADPAWKALAYGTVREYLSTHEHLFVDTFWQDTQLPRPTDSRALGPILVKAARDGLMVRTDDFIPSVASKMGFKPVWKSLIFGGNPV